MPTRNDFKFEGQSASGLVHMVKGKPTLKGKAHPSACKPSVFVTRVLNGGGETCQRCAINLGLNKVGPSHPGRKAAKVVSAAKLPVSLTLPTRSVKRAVSAVPSRKPKRAVSKKYNGAHYDALITRLGKLGVMATVQLETMGWTLVVALKADLQVLVWHPEFNASGTDEWVIYYGDTGTAEYRYVMVPGKLASTDLLAGAVFTAVTHMTGTNNV